MKIIKRIICPVDMYDFQPEAAEYATTLAEALGAKITVLYVMEPLPSQYYAEDGPIPPTFAEEEEAKRRAEAKMPEILSTFFNASVDKGIVVLGLAADQIIRVAEESSADMIIMASHGRSALGRVIHGSVTNKVLANTKIPVLVTKPAG
ncbi:universal stress protein [Desulfovibrio sp. OttesenSCG-928-O18]|nr:universal stress protein [Desulfovibrio sp. OttesenSCG-928-O18]